MDNAGESLMARVSLDRGGAERVLEALSEALDPDRTALALFESAPARWTLAVYFLDARIADAIRALVEAAAGAEAARGLVFESCAERDWVAASLAGLAPVVAGRFVVHGAHDRHRVPPNAVGIEIEAAVAFGTGHHGTTQGCLLALDGLVKRRRFARVADIGTGTGVLAIAAAKALRRRVVASDIDPLAVRAARANARLNRTRLVETIRAPGLGHRRCRQRAPFDLVLANILLKPLQGLARPIARRLAPCGRVVLSGLLAGQAYAALAIYRQHGLALERRILRDGWATLVLRRGG